jgi:hypothetical protein
MFVPTIAGSDGTVVSVATGQNEYHPLYLSIGNVHNQVRRAQRGALVLIGFLAIPKSGSTPCYPGLVANASIAGQEAIDTDTYRHFKKQLFHTSLTYIFQRLEPYMSQPEVVKCADGHFRKAIYGLGPYIADYPEQVLLAGIVTGWCVKYTPFRCLWRHYG